MLVSQYVWCIIARWLGNESGEDGYVSGLLYGATKAYDKKELRKIMK